MILILKSMFEQSNWIRNSLQMLKRLSYPLTWVEGLTGEGGAGPPGSGGSLNKSADTDSAPNTGDSNQSVFSKVFSRCVK